MTSKSASEFSLTLLGALLATQNFKKRLREK